MFNFNLSWSIGAAPDLYTEPRCVINGIMIFTGWGNNTIYKDKKDGAWHFTDKPGEVPASQLTAWIQLSPAA